MVQDTKPNSSSNAESTFSWTPDELSLIGEGNIAAPVNKPSQPVKQPLNKVPSYTNLSAANNQQLSPSFLPKTAGDSSGSSSPRPQMFIRETSEGHQGFTQGPSLAGLGYSSSPVVRPSFRSSSDITRVNMGMMASVQSDAIPMEPIRCATASYLNGPSFKSAEETKLSYCFRVSPIKK